MRCLIWLFVICAVIIPVIPLKLKRAPSSKRGKGNTSLTGGKSMGLKKDPKKFDPAEKQKWADNAPTEAPVTTPVPDDRSARQKFGQKYRDFKQGASEKSDEYKERLSNYIQQKQKDDSEGIMQEYIAKQNAANMDRMNKLTADTMKTGLEMQDAMSDKQDKFDKGVQEAKGNMQDLLAKAFDNSNKDWQDMQFDVNPGSGVVDGAVISPSGFAASIAAIQDQDDGAWANVGDPSPDASIHGGDIEDLLIKGCYRSIAKGNDRDADPNCARADILTFKCEAPVDAAAYIGVTFDITKGYSQAGFRGKLVKHWCREKRKYKKIYDVPDGMHIQGVYETQMSTETFSSISNYVESMSIKSNAQVGSSAFDEERRTLDSTTSDTTTATASLAASGQGFSMGASFQHQTSQGTFSGEHAFSNNKKQRKASQLSQTGKKKTAKTEKMVAKMSINIIRYEMFLREVAPNFIEVGFLDLFLSLPQSYFAPGAPQKFMDFIQRYGTHYVKAAKFGGQLTVTKTKTSTASTDVSDFRNEAQDEFNSIVGSGGAKATTERNEESNDFSLNAGFKDEEKGIEASLDISVSQGSFDETNESTSNSTADVTANSSGTGSRNVTSDSKSSLEDNTSVVAKGGSHLIATSITDLYSSNFRGNLVRWLKSIPDFPKPFDFVYEPITTLMYHLLDDMVDGDCYKTCLIEKEEHCIKQREISVDCATDFGQTSDLCKPQCAVKEGEEPIEGAECKVPSPRLLDCWEVIDQKDKFKRKIEALDTAMTEYVRNGGALINAVNEIKGTTAGCTTGYQAIDIRDPFAFDFGDDESIDWPKVAFANLQVQFNMKRFYFNSNDDTSLRIFPNDAFFLKYDETDRRWYTKDTIEERLRPSIGSPVVSFAELKSADTTGKGSFHLIPRQVADGDEKFVIIRLKHGFYIDLNLKNGDVFFTERSLSAMKAADNILVKNFLSNYEDTLTKMAEGEGQSLGFVNPILNNAKTPFPCTVEWSSAQMFEGAQDVQQCVKITVKTVQEYFFVMASNLADKSTWIYLHQTQTDLCLRKLNSTLAVDEIGECAQRYGRMASGKIDSMSEQLFICMYNVGDLISITVSRPSYDRNQRESAISIINYNLVQHSARGELLIPRYYAMGAGESDVTIDGMFMTELDTLQCQLPYYAEEIGGTFRCKLDCSSECSNHGCKRPNDPTECYTCQNSKLVIRAKDTADVTRCVPTCDTADLEVIDPTLKTTKVQLEQFFDPGMQGRQTVCVSCHHQCQQGCKLGGITDNDCEGTSSTKICKNVRQVDTDNNVQCLEVCPAGTFPDDLTDGSTDGSTTRPLVEDEAEKIFECKACQAGCQTCDGDTSLDIAVDVATHTPACNMCLTCNDGFLEATISTTHVKCIDYTPIDCDAHGNDCCPAGLQRIESKCIKNWRAVGYQIIGQNKMSSECSSNHEGCEDLNTCSMTTLDASLCSTPCDTADPPNCTPTTLFPEYCKTACQITEGTNFLRLESADSFEKFKSTVADDEGFFFFSFQLAWKVDECNVVVLEWNQQNNPLKSDTNNKIEITSFKEVKCILTDPALTALKKVSFSNENFFINCPAAFRQETKLNATNNGFTGLTLNENEQNAFILSGSTDGLYSFGQMDYPDGNRIPSYRLDGETQFSGEMELSVHDDRVLPVGWSPWHPQIGETPETGYECKMDCTDNSLSQKKKRKCRCSALHVNTVEGSDPTDGSCINNLIDDEDCPDTFALNCQPCIGEREMVVNDCELNACLDDATITLHTTTDSVLHHGCCESSAIRVFGTNTLGNEVGSNLTPTITINGIYELVYTSSGDHQYHLMNDEKTENKNVKITQNVDKTWTLSVDGNDYFKSKSANCPASAIEWIPDATKVNSMAKIDVVCSNGRNTCPEEHPFAFNFGTSCCISPIYSDNEDVVSTANLRLLKPTDTTCLGKFVTCPLLPSSGTYRNRCRTNLDSSLAADFKALSNESYKYKFKLCSNHCNYVPLEACKDGSTDLPC